MRKIGGTGSWIWRGSGDRSSCLNASRNQRDKAAVGTAKGRATSRRRRASVKIPICLPKYGSFSTDTYAHEPESAERRVHHVRPNKSPSPAKKKNPAKKKDGVRTRGRCLVGEGPPGKRAASQMRCDVRVQGRKEKESEQKQWYCTRLDLAVLCFF